MFKKEKTESEKDIMEKFEQKLFRRIVDECIEKATDLTFIKISSEIRFEKCGIIGLKLTRYTYKDDTTTIKTRNYTYRDLAHLIVEKEAFIEKIERDFVER